MTWNGRRRTGNHVIVEWWIIASCLLITVHYLRNTIVSSDCNIDKKKSILLKYSNFQTLEWSLYLGTDNNIVRRPGIIKKVRFAISTPVLLS